MIDVLPVDARMLQPPLQRRRVDAMRYVAPAKLPRDADVEAEGKNLIKLVCRTTRTAEYRTARAVLVVAERKSAHEVTYGANENTKSSPASAGLGVVVGD